MQQKTDDRQPPVIRFYIPYYIYDPILSRSPITGTG